MPRHAILHLCASCRRPRRHADAAALRAALAEAGLAVRVNDAGCLGPCEAPVALALQDIGQATYVFAGLDLQADLADIVATCRTFLDSPGGWIDDARPCGRLRFCLRTRVPPSADG